MHAAKYLAGIPLPRIFSKAETNRALESSTSCPTAQSDATSVSGGAGFFFILSLSLGVGKRWVGGGVVIDPAQMGNKVAAECRLLMLFLKRV